MFGKFALVAALSRNGRLELIADYNYIQSLVSFAIIVAGLEVYNLTNRSMIVDDGSNVLAEIILLTIGAALAIVIMFCMTEPRIAPNWIIFILLISEQISQDLFRKLTILRLQINASIVLFVRTGLWAYLVATIELANIWTFSLSDIVVIWFGFSMLSIVVAIFSINKSSAFRKYVSGLRFFGVFADSYYIARYAMLFFISGAIARLPLVLDKIVIREWVTLDVVGVYAVLSTISLGTLSIFESLIVSYKLPQLLRVRDDRDSVVKVIRSFFKSTILLYFFAFAAIWICIYQFEAFGAELKGYTSTLILNFVGIFILSMGIGPHLYLYAMGKDFCVSVLAISHPVMFFAMLLIYAPVAEVDSINILPICFLVSYSCQTVLRYSMYRKFLRTG